jgi:uncharacterized heparinase superfamily protein
MPGLTRYAAAVYYLGLRQAARNFRHRAFRGLRRFDRYAARGSDLVWRGQPTTSFLAHGLGTRLDAGRFTAVGRSVEIGDPPDWDVRAPLLWLFNLHYFAFLQQLPRPERVRLARDWIDRYPPAAGRPGWSSYPISLRLRHWTQWLFADGALSPEDRIPILSSLKSQADCLADGLEYHLRGNHLLENAVTLSFLGACFEGARVERWRRLGARVLREELPEQFLPDGGHFERSPMYHALAAWALLDLVNVLPGSDPLQHLIADRLPAVLRFLAAMRHPDGEIALFNDAALDVAPAPAALLDYARRLGIDSPASGCESFAATGYHVWTDGRSALIVDAGPIGPDYLPGHGHGDIFSFELSVEGRRVVVDGGTSTYEPGPERDWVRSTAAHNTVEIAGDDQCEFFEAFRVGRRGRPHDVSARVSATGLWLAGWHDGYRRLAGRPLHHREIELVAPSTLLVWDTVDLRGAASSAVVSRLRFNPEASVTLESPVSAWVTLDGIHLAVRAFGGTWRLESGHYAPRFGVRLACPVLALHKGSRPEFGYALAPRDLAVEIDADGANVSGSRLARKARRPPPRGSYA